MLLRTRASSKELGRKTILRRLSHGSREDCAGSPDIGKRKCGFLVNGCCIPGYVLRNGHGAPSASCVYVFAGKPEVVGWNVDYVAHKSSCGRSAKKAVLTAGNTIDFGDAITFNVSDLRLAFQIQKWLERNARAGVRYTEFLGAHFGVHPRDERLQRPEYLGGSKNPVIISEVLQTSSTDTESPQGNLAGHGISVGQTFCASYFAEEFGLIMGIMSVMPKPAYQQGLDRQWLRQTRYDFYFPEFANLSEQAIERVELYASAVETENKTIFGYQADMMKCALSAIRSVRLCARILTIGTWAASSHLRLA